MANGSALLEDHKRRVARLLRGERRVTDLDRLFADLRLSRPGRGCVREVGHFAAHRDERDTGISWDRANDIQTSGRLWARQATGIAPTIADLKEAARANLNIITDVRLEERLGISRQTAQTSFSKGIKKLSAGRPMKDRERRCVEVLGLSMMWQVAFDSSTLTVELREQLVEEGALSAENAEEFTSTDEFVTLYALAIMHGARLKMADGSLTQLRLARSDETGYLRIKGEIPLGDFVKPTSSNVPLFETTLVADQYCDPGLLLFSGEVTPADIYDSRLVALV
jgi:hypothetical protein